MTNRRKHHRVKPIIKQHVTLKVVDLSFDVEPKNISTGGLFIQAGVLFPVGALMEIKLEYGGKSATSLVRVQHRQNDGIGFKFLNPSDDFHDLVGAAVGIGGQYIPASFENPMYAQSLN